MSVQESAEQLVSYATTYVEASIGASNAASQSVTSTIQLLQKITEVANDSISRASALLGSGHPGVSNISGSAEMVKSKVSAAEQSLEAALNAMIEMDQAINAHSGTISQTGLAIMGRS